MFELQWTFYKYKEIWEANFLWSWEMFLSSVPYNCKSPNKVATAACKEPINATIFFFSISSNCEIKLITYHTTYHWSFISYNFFFSVWIFFHNYSQITGLREGISLIPHYHFHPLHRPLDISRAIAAGSSPLHIGSSRTPTGNLWFPSASG